MWYKKKQGNEMRSVRRRLCFRLQEGCMMMMIFLVPCYICEIYSRKSRVWEEKQAKWKFFFILLIRLKIKEMKKKDKKNCLVNISSSYHTEQIGKFIISFRHAACLCYIRKKEFFFSFLSYNMLGWDRFV